MSDKIIQNDVSNERLRLLIDSSRKTRENIAKSVGMDTSTITKYYNGDRKLTVDAIKKFAVFFNVSADYLLGLSDAQTADKDLQFVCDYTGLSDSNTERIHHFKLVFDHSGKKYMPEYFNFLNGVFKSIFDIFFLIEKHTLHFEEAKKKRNSFVQLSNNISEMINQKSVAQEELIYILDIFYNEYNSIRREFEMTELQEYRITQLMSTCLTEYFSVYTEEILNEEKNIDKRYEEVFELIAENNYNPKGDTNGGNTKA